MNLLIELTLRGSAAALVVLIFDRSLAGSMSGPSRRWWWCFLPLAFLVPARIPILPAPGRLPLMAAIWGRVPLGISSGITVAEKATAVHAISLFGIWLAGAMAYVALVVIQTSRASNRWSRERLSTDSPLLELLRDCKAEAGVTAHIGLVVSDSVASPAIMGWLRPRILLPASLAGSSKFGELRPILLHELAHLRWFDVPFNWLLTLVRAIHWFNPFAHLGAIAWTRFREEAADEAAIKWMRADSGRDYGEVLVRTLRQTRGAAVPFGALAIGESARCLRRRIHMINRYQKKSPRILLAGFGSVLLAAAVFSKPSHAESRASSGLAKAAVAPGLNGSDGINSRGVVIRSRGDGGDFLIVMPKGQGNQAGHGALIMRSGQTLLIDNAPGP